MEHHFSIKKKSLNSASKTTFSEVVIFSIGDFKYNPSVLDGHVELIFDDFIISVYSMCYKIYSY